MQANAVHVRGADRAECAFVGAHVCRSLSRQGETASLAICFHARNSLNRVCRNDRTSPWRSSLSLLPPACVVADAAYIMDQIWPESNHRSLRVERCFCYVPTIPLLVPDKRLLVPDLLPKKKWDCGRGRRKRMSRLANLTA